ncbi:MAG: class I SAM-dependent methyltransferase [Ornithinimicrobium sp.]
MTIRRSPGPPTGRGDGTITDDGCPVEIYAQIPPAGEAVIINRAIAQESSVLELGCGTGRIADLLARRGHRVVGVDSSSAMLTHLRHAAAVQSPIEALNLDERFDVVVLASHLINSWDAAQAWAFLSVAQRHLVTGGQLVLQRHRPGQPLLPMSFALGEVHLALEDVVDHGGSVYSATLRHTWREMTAEQDFSTRVLADPQVVELLGEAGFQWTRVLTKDNTWLLATRQ